MKKLMFVSACLVLTLFFIFQDEINIVNNIQTAKASIKVISRYSADYTDDQEKTSSFRYNMVTGGLKDSDPVISRMQAVKYTKNEMRSFNENANIAVNWTAKGPGNAGGRIRAIIVHPNDRDKILIGSASGGIWKTVDGGTTWSPKLDDKDPISVCSMVIDPSNPEIVYAGTGEGWNNVSNVYGGGIYKSNDFGDTWTLLPGTAGVNAKKFRCVMKITMDQKGYIYAATRERSNRDENFNVGTNGGLYRSKNQGTDWTKISINSITNEKSPCDVVAISEQTILMATLRESGTSGGIYRSIDYGENWTKMTNGLPANNFNRISMCLNPKDTGRVYAAIQSTDNTANGDGGLKGIYMSNDKGVNWEKLVTPPKLKSQENLSYLYNQGYFNNVIAVDPLDTSLIYAGGVDVIRSKRNGAGELSWDQLTFWHKHFGNPYVHADHHAIAFYTDSSLNPISIFSGNDGGIYKSDDHGATWSKLNNGLQITQFYGGSVFRTGTLFRGGSQDNGTLLYESTENWKEIWGGDGGYCKQDQDDEDIAYISESFLDIRKTINKGVKWKKCTTGLTDAGSNSLNLLIAPLELNPENNDCLIAGSDKVWITNDKADSWTKSSNTLSSGSKITAVNIAKPSENYLGFAGTEDGKIFRCTSLDPANNIDTWTNITPAGNNGAWVRRIVVDRDDNKKIFACYSGYNVTGTLNSRHVWYSNTQGTAWNDISGDLPNVPVHTLVTDPYIAEKIFIGTETGIYVTTNMGANWSTLTDGMPKYVPVDELVYQSGTHKLFAFTFGRSVWEYQLEPPPQIIALIKVIQEGLYNASKRLNKKDTVVSYLRKKVSPYNKIDSAKAVIDSVNFSGLFQFNHAPDNQYYIHLSYKNGIETWSSVTPDFAHDSTTNYDFTQSACSAYGCNMAGIDFSPVRFGIYSGDVNQDGVIDPNDLMLIDNDIYSTSRTPGNYKTDLNGDGYVRLDDLLIAENNVFNFITTIHP